MSEDERFRKVLSWALLALILAATVRLVVGIIDDETLQRAERIYEFAAERRHHKVLEGLRSAEDQP